MVITDKVRGRDLYYFYQLVDFRSFLQTVLPDVAQLHTPASNCTASDLGVYCSTESHQEWSLALGAMIVVGNDARAQTRTFTSRSTAVSAGRG